MKNPNLVLIPLVGVEFPLFRSTEVSNLKITSRDFNDMRDFSPIQNLKNICEKDSNYNEDEKGSDYLAKIIEKKDTVKHLTAILEITAKDLNLSSKPIETSKNDLNQRVKSSYKLKIK